MYIESEELTEKFRKNGGTQGHFHGSERRRDSFGYRFLRFREINHASMYYGAVNAGCGRDLSAGEGRTRVSEI